MNKKRLISKAKDILNDNWKGEHTVPSNHLYPHQWSWDSAFISIGYSHYNTTRAKKELISMFDGQWKNGMLPHIIFRAKGKYFPNSRYWRVDLSFNSPKLKTSGISQPPVHAIAAFEIYKNSRNKKEGKKFLKKLYPKLISYHRYLLTERDPEKTGLVTIFHPWESGFDNSLRWDEAMNRLKPKGLPKYKRIDNKKVDADQRPDSKTYDRYIYLVEIMKKYKYDDKRIYEKIPFKIKDIVISSILYKANLALLKISKLIREENKEIEGWIRRTKKNYMKYFLDKDGLLYDYNVITKKKIKKKTIAALIPIYTGLLGKKQAKELVSFMEHSHFCNKECKHNHPVASSTSFHEKDFNPLNYWRGPIWINTNWMIYKGLKNYGFKKEAKNLKKAMIQLISDHGFYEYYNPINGDGLGTDKFSWTASLLIDLLYEK